MRGSTKSLATWKHDASQPWARSLENRVEPVGEMWHHRGVLRGHVFVAHLIARAGADIH